MLQAHTLTQTVFQIGSEECLNCYYAQTQEVDGFSLQVRLRATANGLAVS